MTSWSRLPNWSPIAATGAVSLLCSLLWSTWLPLQAWAVGSPVGWVGYGAWTWRRRRRRALAVGVARLHATIEEAKRRRALNDHSWRGDEQLRQLRQVLRDGAEKPEPPVRGGQG